MAGRQIVVAGAARAGGMVVRRARRVGAKSHVTDATRHHISAGNEANDPPSRHGVDPSTPPGPKERGMAGFGGVGDRGRVRREGSEVFARARAVVHAHFDAVAFLGFFVVAVDMVMDLSGSVARSSGCEIADLRGKRGFRTLSTPQAEGGTTHKDSSGPQRRPLFHLSSLSLPRAQSRRNAERKRAGLGPAQSHDTPPLGRGRLGSIKCTEVATHCGPRRDRAPHRRARSADRARDRRRGRGLPCLPRPPLSACAVRRRARDRTSATPHGRRERRPLGIRPETRGQLLPAHVCVSRALDWPRRAARIGRPRVVILTRRKVSDFELAGPSCSEPSAGAILDGRYRAPTIFVVEPWYRAHLMVTAAADSDDVQASPRGVIHHPMC